MKQTLMALIIATAATPLFANGFTVASAGADGRFDQQSWSAGGALQSFDDDAMAPQEGRWLFRHWATK